MKRLAIALILVLVGVSVSAQTLGYKHPGADAVKEVWQVGISSGDSVSTYFIVPPHIDKVTVHFDGLTAGGVAFEVAVDTSKASGGLELSEFRVLQTFAALIDTIASTAGDISVDITDRTRGASAVRFHVGYNSTVAQSSAKRIYVFIRKKPPS